MMCRDLSSELNQFDLQKELEMKQILMDYATRQLERHEKVRSSQNRKRIAFSSKYLCQTVSGEVVCHEIFAGYGGCPRQPSRGVQQAATSDVIIGSRQRAHHQRRLVQFLTQLVAFRGIITRALINVFTFFFRSRKRRLIVAENLVKSPPPPITDYHRVKNILFITHFQNHNLTFYFSLRVDVILYGNNVDKCFSLLIERFSDTEGNSATLFWLLDTY